MSTTTITFAHIFINNVYCGTGKTAQLQKAAKIIHSDKAPVKLKKANSLESRNLPDNVERIIIACRQYYKAGSSKGVVMNATDSETGKIVQVRTNSGGLLCV